MPSGAKCWCGTLQLDDITFDGQLYLQNLLDSKIITYGVGQVEQGSHIHFQFYIQMEKRHILTWLKSHVDAHAHWETARGSPSQNRDYCTKEDTRVSGPWEVGQPTGQGRRTDLESAAQMIDDGATMKEVAQFFPAMYVRYHRGLKAYDSIIHSGEPRDLIDEGPEVWVFWGDTGTGKSYRAYTTWPDAYRKTTSDKWWDGYKGQETVIFDDFKGSSMRLHDFQLVIDRYPHDVEVKGGFVPLSAKRYVFTSNKHPSEWYSETADPHGSVMRRINEFCVNHGRLIHMLGEWGRSEGRSVGG
ncbi:replication-associated protein [Northern red-backed vole stool-associated circular virus 11]|uniref:Replication-associated protein n=1 Tax=Northern red-backed vole stool-associated circular virus 11 TaxID=2714164 RepID=A0AAE7C189_9VIRU|nr:replication-associated protein [Northern red-backed vole stool-associated circular virus 11]QIK03923.1 replication-associated protein [Tundra vole stool-associated circular virus]QIK03928.1 replication-associated protein [Northern red-backed vole stool-associated circular virus 11]